MSNRGFVAWLIVFAAWMGGSFLVHGTLLGAEYAALPGLFRPEAESQDRFPLMVAAHAVMAAAFVWMYSRGIAARPWAGQGLRFGLAAALLTAAPTYTIYYVVQPMPGHLVVRQILFDGALVLVLGLATAFTLRRRDVP
jgi:hypothetical protein